MLEYTERRAAVLGHLPHALTCSRPIVGRKRRRGWDQWDLCPQRLPNATVLDIIPEVDEPKDEGHARCVSESPEENKLMNMQTVVFNLGTKGDFKAG